MTLNPSHLNCLISSMLDAASRFIPPTWPAVASTADADLEGDISGLFFWPGQQEMRTLTEDSATAVAAVLIRDLALDVPGDYRFQRVEVDDEIAVLDAFAACAAVQRVAPVEGWAILQEARDLLGVWENIAA